MFGKGPRAGVGRPPPGGGYSQPQAAPVRGSQGGPGGESMPWGYDEQPQQGYGRAPPPPAKGVPARTPVGRSAPGAGMSRRLNLAPVEDKNLANQYIFTNM